MLVHRVRVFIVLIMRFVRIVTGVYRAARLVQHAVRASLYIRQQRVRPAVRRASVVKENVRAAQRPDIPR